MIPPDVDLAARVAEVLDARVRPALAADGVGVEVLGVEAGTVRLRLTGAASGCPASAWLIVAGVEAELRRVAGVERLEVPP
jgi:Fe-S cluster biogenesis protein NfuA